MIASAGRAGGSWRPGSAVGKSADHGANGRRRHLGPHTVLRLRPGHQLGRYDETLRVRAFGRCCWPLTGRQRSGQVTRPASLLSGPRHSRPTGRARVTTDIFWLLSGMATAPVCRELAPLARGRPPGLLPAVQPGAGPAIANLTAYAPPGAGPRRAQRGGDDRRD